MRERPRSNKPRRLADWLNPTGKRKVHSLVDKVYKPKIGFIFEPIFDEANCWISDGTSKFCQTNTFLNLML